MMERLALFLSVEPQPELNVDFLQLLPELAIVADSPHHRHC
jgi:propionate catabolism operon transcriptional regulator